MYIIYIFIYLCIENGWICMYMCPHISDVVLIVFVLYRGLGTGLFGSHQISICHLFSARFQYLTQYISMTAR